MRFDSSNVNSSNLFILVPVLIVPIMVPTIISYMILEYLGFSEVDKNIYCAMSTYVFSIVTIFCVFMSRIRTIRIELIYAIRGLIATSAWIFIIVLDYIVLKNQMENDAYEAKISIFRGVAYGVLCGLFIMWMINLRNVVRSLLKR